MKKLLVMCFVWCLWCSAPLFAQTPGFLEITKAEKKQKGVVVETYKAGEEIPGMSVEGGAAKVGDKIAVGQRVSVPRDHTTGQKSGIIYNYNQLKFSFTESDFYVIFPLQL